MILKINNIYFEKLHKRICIISEKNKFCRGGLKVYILFSEYRINIDHIENIYL